MNKDQLVQALKIVLPGVDTKNTLLEGADTFVFDGKWIKTFNDHLSVSYPLKTKLKCAVRAVEFYAIINKMQGPELELTLADNKLVVKDAVTTLTMSTLSARVGQYIDNLNLENIEWYDLPEDFVPAVKQCLFSAATEALYGALNSVYVGGKDVMTSDNFRASWYTVGGEMQNFLLPVGAAKELSKISVMKTYGLGDAWVHFMDDNEVTFSSRILLGEFPTERIKTMFKKENGEKMYKFPEELLQSLDRVGVMAYNEGTESDLDFLSIYEDKGYLVCKGEQAFGTVEDRIKVPKNTFPSKIKLHVTPKFLKSILPLSRDFRLRNERLILFETDKYHHLISTIER